MHLRSMLGRGRGCGRGRGGVSVLHRLSIFVVFLYYYTPLFLSVYTPSFYVWLLEFSWLLVDVLALTLHY